MFIPNQSAFVEDEKIVLAGLGGPASGMLGARGLIAGTIVETATGWRGVETLSRGARVYTYDGDLRSVKKVERMFFDLSTVKSGDFLVNIPGSVLNTCISTQLMGDQRILLEGAAIERLVNAPAALVRAADLCGLGGIGWTRPAGMLQSVRAIFDEEEILWANTGLMCFAGPASSATQPSVYFPELTPEQTRQAAHQILTAQSSPIYAQAA